MTNPVSGDTLVRYDLVTVPYIGDSMERADDGEWVRYEDVAALIAAGRSAAMPALRCDVTYANWNQCVRPHGHSEPHLTDNGFNWMPTSAPAPLPAPTRWTGLMAGCAPAEMDFSTTNSGDVGGPVSEKP